jgi:hypothetical protein
MLVDPRDRSSSERALADTTALAVRHTVNCRLDRDLSPSSDVRTAVRGAFRFERVSSDSYLGVQASVGDGCSENLGISAAHAPTIYSLAVVEFARWVLRTLCVGVSVRFVGSLLDDRRLSSMASRRAIAVS